MVTIRMEEIPEMVAQNRTIPHLANSNCVHNSSNKLSNNSSSNNSNNNNKRTEA